jgi:hypothetical protein
LAAILAAIPGRSKVTGIASCGAIFKSAGLAYHQHARIFVRGVLEDMRLIGGHMDEVATATSKGIPASSNKKLPSRM